jgi:hypothetical protein
MPPPKVASARRLGLFARLQSRRVHLPVDIRSGLGMSDFLKQCGPL